ncbi:MAG TPA: hypothetical protein VHC45_09965 [Gaiellaceae bacterium]|jgi:hypothetical protein|nr:hypothetical protein [Gaiellaceae bacterium]
MAVYRFLVVDQDGHRLGRFESDRLDWAPGDVFRLDEVDGELRLVEVLPDVSTMVEHNAVWVAQPV